MVVKNFVVFEGIDGAGTSTQIARLKAKFGEERFAFSAEPTKRETGRFLRRVLSGEVSATAMTQAFLFAADRAEHIFGSDGVIAHTSAGKAEVSDRYFFSSIAYQGLGGDEDFVRATNSGFPLPELLFFFDISAEVAMKRIDARGEAKEIFEKRDALEKIAARYRRIIADYEKSAEAASGEMKIVRIDAEKSADDIEKTIYREILQLPIFKV